MSTLSKVFTVLVLVIALVKLGMDITLFGMRVDWKDKFDKEVQYHFQALVVKNNEIADLNAASESVKAEIRDRLMPKINILEVENAGKSARIAELQRQFDAVDTNFKKLIADVDVYVRQLEVQITQIQQLSSTADQYRARLSQQAASASTAMQELQYARQEAERLSKDLAELERSHVDMARNKKHLEEIIATASAKGIDMTGVAATSVVQGKVTAVHNEIGLVIISVGKDDKVLAGQEFTIHRGGTFVAKMVIREVNNTWSAGKIDAGVKKEDPRVGDDVSNSIFTGTSAK